MNANQDCHDSQEEVQLSLDTNLHGPLNLTRSALPHFREKGTGWLIYMTSQAGFAAEPGATGYCASKFALEGLRICLDFRYLVIRSSNLELTMDIKGRLRV